MYTYMYAPRRRSPRGGPGRQGVRAPWRLGEVVFRELALAFVLVLVLLLVLAFSIVMLVLVILLYYGLF